MDVDCTRHPAEPNQAVRAKVIQVAVGKVDAGDLQEGVRFRVKSSERHKSANLMQKYLVEQPRLRQGGLEVG